MNFTDKSGGNNTEVKQLLELLSQYQLSSLADEFLKKKITVGIIWDLDDDILSKMDLTATDRLKYTNARKEYEGSKQQGNPMKLYYGYIDKYNMSFE